MKNFVFTTESSVVTVPFVTSSPKFLRDRIYVNARNIEIRISYNEINNQKALINPYT